MSRSRAAGVLGQCAAIVWLSLLSATVWSQSPVARRESVAVENSPSATRQVSTILELANQADWPRILDLLDDLESRDPTGLVEVDERRVLRAGLVSQILRTQIPTDMLAAHRTRVDLAAQAWLEQGQLTDDERLLKRVLDRTPASTVAPVAINALAEHYWQQGELDTAATIWSCLEPSADAVELDPAARLSVRTKELTSADLAARRVLIEIMDHDFRRAHQLLSRLAADYPESLGSLAGREGSLPTMLREVLALEKYVMSDYPDRVNGGRSANARNLQGDIDVGTPLWRIPLARGWGPNRLSNRPLLSSVQPPEILPVIDDHRIFWASANSVHVTGMNGLPVWPTGDGVEDHLLYAFGGTAADPPEFSATGESLRTVAVDGERLFALLGAGIAVEAQREPRAVESRLVCLDVNSGEGKLLWSVEPADTLPDPTWRYSGPPTASGGRVYVPARRSRPGMAIGIACLDAATGAPIWFRTLAGLLSEPPVTHHIVTADDVIADQDRVYLASRCGCVAGLSAETGVVDWIRRDEPVPWRGETLVPVGESAGRSGLLHRGLLFTLHQDGRTVQCLDARTGSTLWRNSIPTIVADLVGVRCGALVATGDQAWGLDVDTGTLRWRFGYEDVEGKFFGRGMLAGDSLWACTHDELWQVDLSAGEPLRRIPLWDGHGIRGGHLILGDRHLLIASDHELTALRVFR